MTRLTTHGLVKRAERALGELELGVTANADRLRCDRVRQGMRALDDEQCSVKEQVANLLDTLETGYTVPEVIEDLRELVKRWDREQRARQPKAVRRG